MKASGVKIGQSVALLTTSGIKLVGLASAFNQLLIQEHATPLALAVSAFMMAGAQLSEGLVISLLDRLMGGSAEDRDTKAPE